ncbi:uncharacterized protein BDZ99DRAFT_103099 [Mytilinidion resinicola]|uniref:DUF6594 domain-containing protein n=1 Tax=Mytilinidion resinicola TaxID=574789 RepID=A0A6A6YB69_9PEZI|nr:uncharacterized protein BDZ99DRAFT_103099 [Mytilinidion resinicola]KAF2806052.1 hypothetical protein BDZ99DRAFT_103099 [Mytilinidion resinicola]
MPDEQACGGERRFLPSHPAHPTVHQHIAICPQSGVFPRLGELWARTLYELLNDIEEKQRELTDRHDRMVATGSYAGPDEKKSTNEDMKRLKVELRELLLTYGTMLGVCGNVAALPDPTEFHFEDFHEVYKRCTPNGILPTVYGSFPGPIDRDLCVHTAPPSMDPFSRLIIRLLKWLSKKPLFRRCFNDKSTRERGFMTRGIRRTTHVITCAIVPLFYSASIATLYAVKPMTIRLAIIPVFLLVFALSAIFLAGSSRNEMIIFMSAYAAVLVVFVSGNISSP